MDDQYYDKLINLLDKTDKTQDIPVSCLIIDQNNKIVSFGINNRHKTKTISGHAEIEAINKLMKKKKITNLSEYKIISLLEPCLMCFGAISQSKINTISFYLKNDKFGFSSANRIETNNMKINLIGTNEQKEMYASRLNKFFVNKRK